MRIPDKIIYAAGFTAVALILVQAVNAHFWADDFYIYNQLQERGVWDFMWSGYMSWDGRFVSLNALVQLLLIKTDSAPLAVGFWSLMFLTAATLGVEVFRKETGGDGSKVGKSRQVIILLCLMWLGFSNHLSETLYWVTGGIYIMALAMSLGFILFFIRRPDSIRPSWLFGGMVFGLLSGLMGVVASLPLLVFMAVEVALQYRRSLKPGLAYPAAWGGALLAGIVFNIVAPGNFIRAGVLDTSFQLDAVTMGVNFLKISFRYLHFSIPAVGMAVLAVLLFAPKGRIRLKKPSFSFNAVLFHGKWLMTAFSSIVPMLVIPDFAGGRVTIFFTAWLFFWIWITGTHWLKSSESGTGWQVIHPIVRKGLVLVLFASVITIASGNFIVGQSIKRQVAQREAFLMEMSAQASAVQVKPVVVEKIPFSVFFHDLQDDDYARYYGFAKIINDTSEGLPDYYRNPPW